MQTGSIIYIVVLVVAFYFLIIRPQQMRQRQMRELTEALTTGDRVITAGGIHGTVVSVTDSTVVVRVLDNTEIEFEKVAIARIVTDIAPLPEDLPAEEPVPVPGQDQD